ncbi:MAG: hypothetical protein ACYS15_11420 [Planctomycetota bacterium]
MKGLISEKRDTNVFDRFVSSTAQSLPNMSAPEFVYRDAAANNVPRGGVPSAESRKANDE